MEPSNYSFLSSTLFEPPYEKTNNLLINAKTKAQISFGVAVTVKLISAFVFATRKVQSLFFLRVNITIVYEHTVCATSAFSMYMLRVDFNVVLF